MASTSGGSMSAEQSSGGPSRHGSASSAGAETASTNRASSTPSAETTLGGGVGLASIGGALMTVGATMQAGVRSSLWLNACWDIGCILMFGGSTVVIVMLCKGARLRWIRPRQPQSICHPGQDITDERLDAQPARPSLEARPTWSPVLLKIVDEDWKILDGRLWVLALAVTFINTLDKPITLTRFTFENCDRRDQPGDHVDEKINRQAGAEFKRMTEPREAELFTTDVVLMPLTPVTKWVIASAVPLPEGGRPACLLRFEDTLGDSYDVHIERRPVQRFRAW